MTRGLRRSATTVVCAVILAVGAAGCGGDTDDDGSGGSSREPADAAGLEAAVRETGQQIIDGDWAGAYQRLTTECQGRVSLEEWETQATEAVEFAKAFGIDLSRGEITEVQVRDVGDGRGEALLRVEVDGQNDAEPEWDSYVHEDGTWRTTECEPVTDTSGS